MRQSIHPWVSPYVCNRALSLSIRFCHLFSFYFPFDRLYLLVIFLEVFACTVPKLSVRRGKIQTKPCMFHSIFSFWFLNLLSVWVWRSSECSAKRVRLRYTHTSFNLLISTIVVVLLAFFPQSVQHSDHTHHVLYYRSRMFCSALALRWLDLFVRLFIAHSSSTLVLCGTYISCVRVVTFDIVEYHSLRENIQYMVDWRKWFTDSVLISHRKLLDEFRCTIKSETKKSYKSTNNISKHTKNSWTHRCLSSHSKCWKKL